MPSAAVNGTSLFYEEMGAGPTCLVLHGWPGTDHTYLRPGLDFLADRLRLVYYDQRGGGRSAGSPDGGLTVAQLADDAAALVATLGVERPVVLGHHHGASVALELALRHPGRVAGLVLVAGTPGELGQEESLLDALDASPTPPEVEVLQRVPPGSDDELAATMRALSRHFFRRPDPAAEDALFARTAFSAEAAGAAMVAFGWWSSVDRLPEMDVPTLLLAGRHDVFCPPFQSARIARWVSAATSVVLEESGHLPWLEEPEAFLTAVHAWLEQR